MLKIEFDASGLLKHLGGTREEFLSGLQAGLKEAAKEVESRAKELTPEKTGELRQSIQSDVEMSASGGTGWVYTDNQYAIYVHEGAGLFSRTGMGRKEAPWTYYDERTGQYVRTSGTQATPFLEDAVNEKREKVQKIIYDEIAKRLGR